MVYESARDATFSIQYDRTPDRFTIEGVNKMPILEEARLELGSSDDFILFDNDIPGALRFASHSGQNKLAVATLAQVLFDEEYALFSESMREGAKLYNLETRLAQVEVSYSNKRRLARIALHARATGASAEVKDLHARISAFSDGDDVVGRQLSGELSDDQPTGAPVQVQPDF